MPAEKYRIIYGRLDEVSRICAAAEQMLENGSPKSMERSFAGFERAAAYYGEELPVIMDILVPAKKFIVIHELFPGHYIQAKIARENPHHIRILFPYGLYFEGWATLCERIALDAGWDNGFFRSFY